MSNAITKIEGQIVRIREELMKLGSMRPGSLSRQYKNRKEKKGAFWQLSYTHKMKSRTEHVWPEHREGLEKEIAEYRKFKALTQELIDLSIERSKANIAYLRKHSTR